MRNSQTIDNPLVNTKGYRSAFNKALFFLKFRPRSEKEVRDNLVSFLKKKKKELSEKEQVEIIDLVVSRLTELDFLNDRKFALYFLERRFRENPKGKRVVVFELKQKGINPEIIEETYKEVLQNHPSTKILGKLLTKAVLKYRLLPDRLKREKLIAYLLRRGFSYNEVSSLVDEFVKKQ